MQTEISTSFLDRFDFRNMIMPNRFARLSGAPDDDRMTIASLLWENAHNNVANSYYHREIKDPGLANIMLDSVERHIAWETECPDDEVWRQAEEVSLSDPDLREIFEFADFRRDSSTFGPFSDLMVTLIVEGKLEGARAVDRKRVFNHEMGRVLCDGVLIMRDGESFINQLWLCVEHGARALASVQGFCEGMPRLLDSEEAIQEFRTKNLWDLYEALGPGRLRLSVYDFGTSEKLRAATESYRPRWMSE